MKYVLDASVAVRWVLRDLLQAKARQLRTAYQNRAHELLAPDIFIAEVAGALTKAERQKIIRGRRQMPRCFAVTSAGAAADRRLRLDE